MVRQIDVFKMGTMWCIQVDERQALISAHSDIEARETAEQLLMWQPEGPPDPFIDFKWELIKPNHYRMFVWETGNF